MFTGPPRQRESDVGREQRLREPNDGELLESFLQTRHPEPFEILVLRHAPMVLGVCRRVLGNRHDAEDAFQATFLVLVRKASSIRPRDLVANWLYGVAYRTSLQARSMRDRRARRERLMNQDPELPADAKESDKDWLGLLDEELSQLPESYRVPLVLCELEGLSYREAGAQMGLSEKAVSVRLVRARKMLAARLARHATLPTAAICTLSFTQETASAAVPPALVSSTVQAAPLWALGSAASAGVVSSRVATLAQSVLKGMLLLRFKLGAILLAVATLGMTANSAIGWVRGRTAGHPHAIRTAATAPDRLDGIWRAVIAERDGKRVSDSEFEALPIRLEIEGPRVSISSVEGQDAFSPRGTLTTNPGGQPAHVDLIFQLLDGYEIPVHGICRMTGDRLMLCYGRERPTEFRTNPGRDDQRLFVFEREPASR